MARVRMIKPEFFTDRKLARLSYQARLLFVGLWTIADREGKLVDAPNLIGGSIFPYDSDVDVSTLLHDLVNLKLIDRYMVDGEGYILIINFTKHQNPHPKEKGSVIPCNLHGSAVEKVVPGPSDTGIRIPDTGIRNTRVAADAAIPFDDIISHLNEKTRQEYRSTSKATQEKIRARWNDGWRLNDFLQVNSIKATEWLGTEMAKYLRPETLYGPKFESYLNQKNTPAPARFRTQQEKDDDAVLDSMRRSIARNGEPESGRGIVTTPEVEQNRTDKNRVEESTAPQQPPNLMAFNDWMLKREDELMKYFETSYAHLGGVKHLKEVVKEIREAIFLDPESSKYQWSQHRENDSWGKVICGWKRSAG